MAAEGNDGDYEEDFERLMRAEALDKDVFRAQMSSTSTLPNIPQVEYEALQDLYDSTLGSSWHWVGNGSKWDFSGYENPCAKNWQGIVCTCTNTEPEYYPYAAYYFYSADPPASTSTCNIQKLTLIGYNLDGTIPRSIGNFSMLTHMHICRNSLLVGTIPPEVGQLTALSYLSISSNRQLSGSIPSTLHALTTLQYFCLYVCPSVFALQCLRIVTQRLSRMW